MTVDVVFADASLGGTSRSALTTGLAWRRAGYDVRFRPQVDVHPSRAASFEDVGEMLQPGTTSALAPLVHLHHAAFSRAHRQRAMELMALARQSAEAPRLLTHNIFGVEDRVLGRWPGGRTVGLLGHWVAEQYRSAMLASRSVPRRLIVPNPQDSDHFVAAGDTERAAARAEFGITVDQRLVLRVGSPHPDKWSRAYVEAIRRNPTTMFLLVGTPMELITALVDSPNVIALPQTGDEQLLSRAYAAADVFAHIADRGESFGNVLLEALLCGLPAVYLARPYRDNTPWEFRVLPGFAYAHTEREWEEKVIFGPARNDVVIDRRTIVERYGVTAVGEQLARFAQGDTPLRPRLRPSLRDRTRIAVLHNPVASALKSWRLRIDRHG